MRVLRTMGYLLAHGLLVALLLWNSPTAPRLASANVPAALTPTSVPPTPTNTSVPATPTATSTSVPPTPTSTSVPPTPTSTSVPPTPTSTSVPPRPSPEPERGEADPSLTKTVEPASARIGDEVVFTLTVVNHGDGKADDVVVTDPFPDTLDVIEGTSTKGSVVGQERTVIVTIGTLNPGEEVVIRIRARINARASTEGITNSATLSTSARGDILSNNFGLSLLSILPSVDATATPPGDAPGATPPPAAGPAGQPAISGGSGEGQAPGVVARPSQPRRMPRTTATGGETALAWLGLGLLGVFLILASLFIRRCRPFL